MDYTSSDSGRSLFLNLESYRDVSTAASGWDDITVDATVIAEPSTLVLVSGIAGILLFSRRSRRSTRS